MPMTTRQRLVLQQQLLIDIWSGADGYGNPTFLNPTRVFACRITEEPEYVRRLGDSTIQAKSMIWMDVQDLAGVQMAAIIVLAQGAFTPPPTMAEILAKSRITLPDGSTPVVYRFAPFYDPAGIHHFVLWTG